MTLSMDEWQQRYLQQAQWTENLRKYIYNRLQIRSTDRILDTGCGTGSLESELNQLSPWHVFGLDINQQALRYAKQLSPSSLIQGDAFKLPFATGSFDISLCHFLLLWINNPGLVINEMIRVTRPNGHILALAEPDYGGRIDYPEQLSQLGTWQIKSLSDQGANPSIGRELRAIFSHAGLTNIEVGVIGGQWNEPGTIDDLPGEWKIIQSDLRSNIEFIQREKELMQLEIAARSNQERILYVPTFYAIGQVKN